VVGGAAAYLAIATVPQLLVPLGRGVDESWIYAINYLPDLGYAFGRDVLFTYGPLGYLLFPAPIGTTLPIAVGFVVLVQAALVGVVLDRYLRSRSIWLILTFVVLYLLAAGIGLSYENHALILVGLILSIVPGQARGGLWAVAAACLAAVLLYAKLNLGLAAAAALLVAWVVWWRQRWLRPARAFLYLGLPYLAAVLLLSFPLMQGPVNLARWLSGGLDLVTGYAESMALPITPVALVLAASAALAVVATAAWVGRAEPMATLRALPVGVILLAAFRHAFIRQDGHPFFAVAVAAMAILVLNTTSRRAFARVIAGASLLLPLALLGSGASLGSAIVQAFDARPGGSTLISSFHLDDVRRTLVVESRANLVDERLPPEMLAVVQGETVDSLPVGLTFLYVNDLSWIPNPALQTYVVFSPRLDKLNAEHFARAAAPSFLLYQFTDIDQRHPILAYPAMWRSILRHYQLSQQPHSFGPFGEVALIEKRRAPVPLRMQTRVRSRGRFGEWIEVPPIDSLAFASIDLRHTTFGRLTLLLWRIEPLFIDLQYEDGRDLTFRFVPGTARNGVLLNYLPSSMFELLNLFQGIRPAAVVRFRIRGPGTGSYQEPFAITWRSTDWLDTPERPMRIGAIPPVIPGTLA
jgi:hypothetical protein